MLLNTSPIAFPFIATTASPVKPFDGSCTEVSAPQTTYTDKIDNLSRSLRGFLNPCFDSTVCPPNLSASNVYAWKQLMTQHHASQINMAPKNQFLAKSLLEWVSRLKGMAVKDIQVVIPGFGVHVFEITTWLDAGARVMAVESYNEFNGRRFDLIGRARHTLATLGYSQVEVRDYRKLDDSSSIPQGDIVVWTHPYIDSIQNPDIFKTLKMYAKEGGLVVLQTEMRQELLELLCDRSDDRTFTPLYSRATYGAEAPLASLHTGRIDEMGDPLRIDFAVGLVERQR